MRLFNVRERRCQIRLEEVIEFSVEFSIDGAIMDLLNCLINTLMFLKSSRILGTYSAR